MQHNEIQSDLLPTQDPQINQFVFRHNRACFIWLCIGKILALATCMSALLLVWNVSRLHLRKTTGDKLESNQAAWRVTIPGKRMVEL